MLREPQEDQDTRPQYVPQAPKRVRDQEVEPSNVLGVFGLSYQTTEDTLRDLFGKHGAISRCVIIRDRMTQVSKGFGFITFETVDEAKAARDATNSTDIDGRNVRVDFSLTKKPHEPTPGMYMGERIPPPRRPYGGRSEDRYGDRPSRYDDRPYSRDRDRGYDRYDDRRAGDRYPSDRHYGGRYEEEYRRRSPSPRYSRRYSRSPSPPARRERW